MEKESLVDSKLEKLPDYFLGGETKGIDRDISYEQVLKEEIKDEEPI